MKDEIKTNTIASIVGMMTNSNNGFNRPEIEAAIDGAENIIFSVATGSSLANSAKTVSSLYYQSKECTLYFLGQYPEELPPSLEDLAVSINCAVALSEVNTTVNCKIASTTEENGKFNAMILCVKGK